MHPALFILIRKRKGNGRMLKEEIRETATLLYQNKEKEGLQKFTELLPVLQQIGMEYAKKCGTEEAVLQMLKNLLDGYRVMDILQIADILWCDAWDMAAKFESMGE